MPSRGHENEIWTLSQTSQCSLPLMPGARSLATLAAQVARFNHSHKVSDIRRFIRAARPNEDVSAAYSADTGRCGSSRLSKQAGTDRWGSSGSSKQMVTCIWGSSGLSKQAGAGRWGGSVSSKQADTGRWGGSGLSK